MEHGCQVQFWHKKDFLQKRKEKRYPRGYPLKVSKLHVRSVLLKIAIGEYEIYYYKLLLLLIPIWYN